MKQRSSSQLGYTAVEMVVVVAIVGLFTLAAIPHFLQMYRSNQLRTGARTFASDVRFTRMQAITNGRPTKMSFAAGSADYSMWELNAANVWIALRPKGQTHRQTKLPEGVTVLSHTFVDISALPAAAAVPDDADSIPDLVYLPDGSPWQLTDSAEKITLRTRYTTGKRNFDIEVRPAGNLKTTSY